MRWNKPRPHWTTVRGASLAATWGALLSFAILLSACVSDSEPRRQQRQAEAAINSQLSALARLLPGTYGNYQQFHSQRDERGLDDAPAPPLLSLEITASGDIDDDLQYQVHQWTRGDSDTERRFHWRLSVAEPHILLAITPLSNPAARPCLLRLLPTANGFSASASPQQCAVGDPNRGLGLRKEILINLNGITIADQVIQAGASEPVASSILRFQRINDYEGWAGLRNERGEWTLAQPFRLHNDGDSVLLSDVRGESLGYRLQLARVIYRQDQPAILRLALYREPAADDPSAAAMTAYAWSSPEAAQIGLNLDWFQAGLSRTQE
ncbi:MAG: hypothetical protein Tsb002_13620 [Wenzhouxiangellaceae bacterium]